MRDDAVETETETGSGRGLVAGIGSGRALVIDGIDESGRRLADELARAGYSVRVCADDGRGFAASLGEPPQTLQRVTASEVRRLARGELERELRRQLVDCRGNLAEVARRMGKDRSTIRYHLRRFGMLVDGDAAASERGLRDASQERRHSVG